MTPVAAVWQAINRHERGLGEPQGRPRVKLMRTDELLRVAGPRERIDLPRP